MAHKKLDDAQITQLTDLVMDGKTPEDIAHMFGIAVSSVHNYKNLLRKQGLDVPNVRGKRPSGLFSTVSVKHEDDEEVTVGTFPDREEEVEVRPVACMTTVVSEDPAVKTSEEIPTTAVLPGGVEPVNPPTHLQFIIHGMEITVEGSASSIDITPGRMVITF